MSIYFYVKAMDDALIDVSESQALVVPGAPLVAESEEPLIKPCKERFWPTQCLPPCRWDGITNPKWGAVSDLIPFGYCRDATDPSMIPSVKQPVVDVVFKRWLVRHPAVIETIPRMASVFSFGFSEYIASMMSILAKYYLQLIRCIHAPIPGTSTRSAIWNSYTKFMYPLLRDITKPFIPNFSEKMFETVIIGPIGEEFAMGYILLEGGLKGMEIIQDVLGPVINRLFKKMIRLSPVAGLDIREPGVARTIAVLLFSLFISGPIFAYGHSRVATNVTLLYTKIWSRVVLDQMYIRYGLAGSIVNHSLWNLFTYFRFASATTQIAVVGTCAVAANPKNVLIGIQAIIQYVQSCQVRKKVMETCARNFKSTFYKLPIRLRDPIFQGRGIPVTETGATSPATKRRKEVERRQRLARETQIEQRRATGISQR